MGVYDEYGTDTQAEVEGNWHSFDGGFKLRIARAGGANREFTTAIAEQPEKFANLTRAELTGHGVLADVYAKAVIKEKEDPNGALVTREGIPIEIGSPEMAQMLRDLPELYRMVQEFSMNRRYFRLLTQDDTAKKSQTG